MVEQDLVGKVAVITGASRGIGRATAKALAARGCSILGTCSSAENIELRKYHVPTCAQTIADAVSDLCGGRVDIFINNAADSLPGQIGEMTAEEIQRSVISNIQTPVLTVDELVKRNMFKPGSRIIYISSVRSRQPWPMQLMYAATKSAGESLCRTWSQAFGGREEKFAFMAGTTANAVTVGLTETDSVMMCPPEALETFKQEFIPLQSIPKFGQPEDVADVISMLCSHEARWITGSVISASGGGIKIG